MSSILYANMFNFYANVLICKYYATCQCISLDKDEAIILSTGGVERSRKGNILNFIIKHSS